MHDSTVWLVFACIAFGAGAVVAGFVEKAYGLALVAVGLFLLSLADVLTKT